MNSFSAESPRKLFEISLKNHIYNFTIFGGDDIFVLLVVLIDAMFIPIPIHCRDFSITKHIPKFNLRI